MSPANKSQITNISIFFLLNVAEDENLSANKYENAQAQTKTKYGRATYSRKFWFTLSFNFKSYISLCLILFFRI